MTKNNTHQFRRKLPDCKAVVIYDKIIYDDSLVFNITLANLV